jgi:hypothetical protein
VFQFGRIDVRRRIAVDPILLRQETKEISQGYQMTSHASSAQPPAIKGSQESANIIPVGVRKTHPAAMQKPQEMD